VSPARVLVIRSGANPFASFADGARVEIVERASHAIVPVEPVMGALEGPADWVIFTSQVAVERVFGDTGLAPRFRKGSAGAQLVAVGAATGEALASRGAVADLIAGGSAESILERLPADLAGRAVLLPCGEDASPDLPERLRSRGARVNRVVVYRKVANPREAGFESEILERPFAAFCTTSPSAARWLFHDLGDAAATRLRGTPAVVLGRFTRRFLESYGVVRIEVTEQARFAQAVRLLELLAAAPSGT
jgi:uroporphyrinogen III methyltransferase/synthase